MAQHNGRSDTEGMAEFAKQLWERYMRQRVISDLLKHSLDGYKAKVVSNNGDGTLTVIRPYDVQSLTLKCPPALATWAAAGDQVLVVSLGDASNSFILCATDIDGFDSDILSDQDPLMDGTVSPGTSNEASRADHVHPSDTSRVPTSRTINGYDLTQDVTLTAADVGALSETGTADRAKQLSLVHYFTVTQDQWYKIFEMQMTTSMARHLLLTINNTGSRYCGIVYCYFNRNAQGVASSTRVRWLGIEGFNTSDLRVTDATENGVTTFSLYLRARATNYVFISTIRTMSRTSTVDVSDYWLSEAVSAPPTTAINAMGPVAVYDGNGNGIASTYARRDGFLWFSTVAVAAGTAQQILSISDATITDEYVLARIEFADPNYITTGYTWTTASGSFTLTGTATAATTANVLLVRKGN